ncbi:glycogen synthase GlgA [Pontibacillus yanchengensis]|uniref:Glycogen synthase GlgA n=2 Tax=Pontibacillus yanchengensis TaxID=462910 RepID=A0ACC7VJ12_9BACI|nr:glycogen synthase GlgA [Pontibacillus yanchengensis]MYL34849.1 glycogen synthase GlgA [Pontibacillus yanchengensis]MYL54777.1 glycogen synthase GlgA [Pontibacillus yanchengensis]
MNILFVASECVPFSKTGGLADVIGSLPISLQEQGLDVRVIVPKYKSIPDYWKNQMREKHVTNVSLGWREQYCGVEELEIDGIHYYFIDNEFYFGRDYIYGQGNDYEEAERFAFFSKAVLESLPALDFQPDILHVHDWQTALTSLYLQTQYAHKPFYEQMKTVLTIHNLKYQGVFPADVLGDLLELGEEYFTSEQLEFYGQVNFLKTGLIYADYLTTVSDTYAREIQQPAYGEGLEGVLQKCSSKLVGIPNGIDYRSYNPYQDVHLHAKRGVYDWKSENKRVVQERFGLPKLEVPMLAMVTRLVEQKGIDLLTHVIEDLLEEDIQVVIVGEGETYYEELLLDIAAYFPKKMAFQPSFDEALSHQIYAASDLLLMPSKYEPCGVSQLIALQYETVPVVRETGGLKDTIHSYDERTGDGNGFSFEHYNADEMLHTIKRALACYEDPFVWWRINQNIRKCDVSWTQSSLRYKNLYERVCELNEAVVL